MHKQSIDSNAALPACDPTLRAESGLTAARRGSCGIRRKRTFAYQAMLSPRVAKTDAETAG